MNSEADESPVSLGDKADLLPDATPGLLYCQRFLFILDHVSNEPCFASLFSRGDGDCIASFINMTGETPRELMRSRNLADTLSKSISKLPEIVQIENISSTTYFELCNLRHHLDYLTLKSKFTQAYEQFQKHLHLVTAVIENSSLHRHDLPRFLRRYSPPNLALRLIRIGVNVCERLRKYHESVKLILIALSSDFLTNIGSSSLCFFIKRLLLDQGTHCRDPVTCLKKVQSLLHVLQGLHPRHRLEIQIQIGRLIGEKSDNALSHFWLYTDASSRSLNRNGNSSLKEITDSAMLDSITALRNELLPQLKCAPVVNLLAPIPGLSADLGARRPVYLWVELEEDVTKNESKTSILEVENWALKHYLHNEKFEKGLHAESRICTTLFALLFYDLLFGVDRADAFYSMLQTAPLDLFAGEFYTSHRDLIESRLEMISSAKRSLQTSETESLATDPISQMLVETWTKHKDEYCIGACWNLFPAGENDVVASFKLVVLDAPLSWLCPLGEAKDGALLPLLSLSFLNTGVILVSGAPIGGVYLPSPDQ
ncbi:unnamed protein product [Hydatigera taeniaeformis]|uniref:Fanconi-associated nuclease n=1 Tax=Hydatigena taeniaeformis TaxID=6205 RepID=A0A158RE49_HYDTA|nr:unnamed protein product [Hydatigera taeniaeformis]